MKLAAVAFTLGIMVATVGCSAPTIADAGNDAVDIVHDVNTDATSEAGACRTDIECSDGVFCNGLERCMPGAPNASARGCLPPASVVCSAGQTCNETTQRCSTSCADADHDGHGAISCGGDDCDDNDPNRFPGNVEVCDAANHDEDCQSATFGLRDADGDGYYDHLCCNTDAMTTMLHCGADCDDAHASVHPAAPETCDGLDNDCNGLIDDGVTRVCWADHDGDGFGDPSMRMTSSGCTLSAGCVENSGDCDDSQSGRNPASPEFCNGVDDNCDGMIDNGVPLFHYYADCDGDGFGAATDPGMSSCNAGRVMACNGHLPVLGNNDCDDMLASRSPAAPEVCNGIDDNCDGAIDNDLPTYNVYPDCDGDGFGDASSSAVSGCSLTIGALCNSHPAVQSNTDCDDTHATRNPASPEVCNGIDDNCDGIVDNGLPVYTYYPDCDGDGFGRTSMSVMGCGRPTANPAICGTVAYAGWSLYTGDCDDSQFYTYPGAVERCDGIDNNCDGTNGEDNDGDGHVGVTSSCARGAGFFLPIDDCRDDLASVHPGVSQYFTSAACSTGIPCTYTLLTPPSGSSSVFACIAAGTTCPAVCLPGSCPASIGSPTWDYDCSGASDLEPSTAALCAPAARSGPCLGSGVTYVGAPACGSSVTTWNCPPAFSPPACPAATTSTGPVPCR